MKIIKRNGAEAVFDLSKLSPPSPGPTPPWQSSFK